MNEEIECEYIHSDFKYQVVLWFLCTPKTVNLMNLWSFLTKLKVKETMSHGTQWCQELARLLSRAKVVADTYSAPNEVHGLFDYYQHMVELMTHILKQHIVLNVAQLKD